MTSYWIESEYGDAISEGIPSETRARELAQHFANKTGRTVYYGPENSDPFFDHMKPVQPMAKEN